MSKTLFLLLAVLLLQGCVSIKEAKRYGEVRYWAGKFDCSIEHTQRLIDQHKRERTAERFKERLNDFEKLAEEAAKETNEKYKDRIEELTR